jgi:sortase A
MMIGLYPFSASNSAHKLNDEQRKNYNELLDIGGLGIMGYIEVPSIGVALPIYHGTDESLLQVAIGHLEWTSLPVGGEGSHCVVSGHRGLPSARLFTDLDKMVVGDLFMMRVLDEVLTYEVDQILIVEPHETDALRIMEGEDFCTLVTCTPYGVNSHRLLVRGARIDYETAEKLTSNIEQTDSTWSNEYFNAILLGVGVMLSILSIFAIIKLIIYLFRKRKKDAEENC